MGFMVKCSIVLLTVTVVGAVLSSSSDSGQENKEVKDADGLRVEDRSESGQDHARGEPERNELIAKRQTTTYRVGVHLASYSELSHPVDIRLSGCHSKWTPVLSFVESWQLPLSAGATYSANIGDYDIGTDVKFIEVRLLGDGEWAPLKFVITHGENLSIKHECYWANLCTYCTTSQEEDCPFRIRQGINAIPCRRVPQPRIPKALTAVGVSM